MADIACAKCEEPWDAYGVRHATDMTRIESHRFLAGEGCPSCCWGRTCTQCGGTGRQAGKRFGRACFWCFDKGFVLAWSPRTSARGFEAGRFYVGSHPDVRPLPEDAKPFLGQDTPAPHESADGWVDKRWFWCPDGCSEDWPPCVWCAGSGNLTIPQERADWCALEAASSEIEASDEDPFVILERRGLEP